MPKTKINVSADIRRGKIARIKSRRIQAPRIKRGKTTNGLIASMNLDEMLEASKVAEMKLRGEKIPVVKSPKVRKYVGTVSYLNKRESTKPVAKKIQQNLNVQIIKKNKKTTNEEEGKRLYSALMEEE